MGAATTALDVKSLTKVFHERGNKSVKAVDSISFQVNQGEVLGLLGPNGAGKTTTIKCILGLMRPDTGEIRVFGENVEACYPRVLRNMSAVLEGSRNLYWRLTVWENILFFARLHGVTSREDKAHFENLIRLFSLEDKRNVEVRKLSQGMKQKTSIVCTLARRTPVVFLDEPTLGLDVETSLELRHVLKQLASEENRTIIVSSHNMDVIQDVCRRVIILSQGRIVADDHISDLVSLFKTKAYRIILLEPVPEGLEEALASRFKGATVTGDGRRTEVRVNLLENDDIYTLMDILRDRGAIIDEISNEETDLEKAFLEIVRRERNNHESS
ncbi:MAG: ABC transporter ATP-binding protein [Bacillota bacterium]|nr:ABC transporter ATP-binding protein [Bacillota bacterium]HCD41474.1 ABC transporter ATP-binding protein [Bacillota bacterium]HOJ57748.1 ABC transporter ATP-binding protein [Bacillota bacterium]HOL02108.1 ABC transporter ATP-binding protein [Bacillota bacterium]HPO80868.1 ABC transporter ATP-binding protein [Bacillota bacterium]